ncbi:MAG: SemiSWEET family sugar transporter [Actinomycetota bacterium]
METALAIGAAGWGILMALSPVLQIRRIVERRSSEDVSIGYFLVLIVGFVLWLSYGLSINNMTLVVPNSVAFLVSVVTVVIALRFRPKDGRPTAGDQGG